MSVSPVTSSNITGLTSTQVDFHGGNMACYHPLHAFPIGVNEDTGKPKYQIEAGYVERIHPRKGHKQIVDQWITNYTEIPCGQCIGCRLDYSRQWATRCMLEAKEYKHNAFLTLTYDQEHITWVQGANRETGEVEPVTTLVPEDLTKFMKDLRRYYKYHYNHDKIRFYACGEYGSKTFRAHFHIIAFNLPIEDKEYFFTNNAGDKIYLSKTIEQIWGKGQVSIGDVTWNSAAYTARYVMKKVKGKDAERYYKTLGVVPEFVRMSRREGIGRKYYEENKDKIYELDEIIITSKKGLAQKVKPSKYYDRLFDLDSPEAMKALKKRRQKLAMESMEIQLAKTSLNKEEYLQVKENNKLNQIKTLVRAI